MELTKEEKQIILNIITQSKFTPNEWEQVVKKIVIKLQDSLVEEKPKEKPEEKK